MAATLPVIASVSAQQLDCVTPQFKLRLADYVVNGASIGCGPYGTMFACSIWPVSDETMDALDSAALSLGWICLLLPEPLLLDRLALERKDLQSIRIVGHIGGYIYGDGAEAWCNGARSRLEPRFSSDVSHRGQQAPARVGQLAERFRFVS